MKKYNPQEIEKKWQKYWKDNNVYKVNDDFTRTKFYILDMFPYPSGDGLHVGHPKGYIATDIFSRYKRLNNYNVLHPMGWDAFGLPAENFAIQNKIHPSIAVERNIKRFKEQLSIIGFDYDWDREIKTSDPSYYKWTQWIFLKLYEKGLAYESYEPINWCPSCKTGLANEDLENGRCERCGSLVEKRPMRQWVLKITDYAERLLQDLSKLEWEESIIESQRNWIGKSEGAEIKFKIDGFNLEINIFTTRIDTIYGCTYIVVAPENKLINELSENIGNINEVKEYINKCKNKSDLERTDLNKEKTGIKLNGIYAINPFNNEKVEVWTADYVLNSYGTGAVMGVPAHDKRDFEFAQKYGLKIIEVIDGNNNSGDIYTDDGILFNSGEFSELDSEHARIKMTEKAERERFGNKKINYKIKDWVFSRQRYWGEPIPIIHCPKCGIVPLREEDLPLELPGIESYEPSGTGESPLATISDWVNVKCPVCGGNAKRETNTMPQWAGSSWYYLRYIDPHNNSELINKEKEKYWMNVDLYVGGAEHATRHLIYARFWHKFLYDLGIVSTDEPFQKLYHVGLIQAEDGRKMSKRYGNIINPDDIINEYGADSLRVYEMFIGPFSQNISWSTNGLKGARRFLDKVWNLQYKVSSDEENKDIKFILNKTIKKVTEDIEQFSFNTAISQMMIFINKVSNYNNISRESFNKFLIILFPFAPHITEEIYDSLNSTSILDTTWPKYDKNFIIDKNIKFVVYVNGKMRDVILIQNNLEQDDILNVLKDNIKIQKYINGKEIKKIIFVKNKMINFVF
ncbi:MAG TPA: leucine--tRNA ligase [bacterium]|nr:leucine--tRNA ligase [bacterium]